MSPPDFYIEVPGVRGQVAAAFASYYAKRLKFRPDLTRCCAGYGSFDVEQRSKASRPSFAEAISRAFELGSGTLGQFCLRADHSVFTSDRWRDFEDRDSSAGTNQRTGIDDFQELFQRRSDVEERNGW